MVYVTGDTHGDYERFSDPFLKKLDEDEAVDIVRYIDTHPELDDRKLYVKVNSGDPLEAIARASRAMSEYFSGIKE